MPDLSKGKPQLFNMPDKMLDKAVLFVVYMLRDEPAEIPDMLEALGLEEHARLMVA